jgi:hypothetical protein
MSYYFESYLTHYENLWYQTEPLELQSIENNQQQNDVALMQLKNQMLSWIKKNELTKENFENSNIQEKLKPFIIEVLKLDEKGYELLFDHGYVDVSEQFIKRAVSTWPDMDQVELNQALRNMWVILSLQSYMGCELKLTNSTFAYSMLYPLTDNYLDNDKISKSDKYSFNERFFKKIKGDETEYFNDQENMIFSMIDEIEKDFNRDKYPKVYTSLLSILDGQNKSLNQHNMKTLSDINVLRQTIYKGGTSVLADAFLIKGDLTEEEALFAYGYGVLLQFADDFEDIVEDINHLHTTIPNIEARINKLDQLLLKYQSFSLQIFEQFTYNEKQKALSDLITNSHHLLLLGIVYNNQRFYSKTFLRTFSNSARFSKRAFLFKNRKLSKIKLPNHY